MKISDSDQMVANIHRFRRSCQSVVYKFRPVLRSIAFCRVQLAEINLNRGELDGVAEELATSNAHAHQYQDRPCLAQIQRAYAHLHTLRSNLPAAHAALTEAIDLFERLGMRRELVEARAELAQLEATIAHDGAPART
jgi:hypothetical protein